MLVTLLEVTGGYCAGNVSGGDCAGDFSGGDVLVGAGRCSECCIGDVGLELGDGCGGGDCCDGDAGMVRRAGTCLRSGSSHSSLMCVLS